MWVERCLTNKKNKSIVKVLAECKVANDAMKLDVTYQMFNSQTTLKLIFIEIFRSKVEVKKEEILPFD